MNIVSIIFIRARI